MAMGLSACWRKWDYQGLGLFVAALGISGIFLALSYLIAT